MWELRTEQGPLQKQYMLLTSEPGLQPKSCLFLKEQEIGTQNFENYLLHFSLKETQENLSYQQN